MDQESAPRELFVRRGWYGGQTLGVIGASLGLGILGTVLTGGGGGGVGGVLATLGSLGVVFGGPSVHWAHGYGGKGLASLGLYVGLPIVTGLAGWGLMCAVGGCRGDFGGFVGLAIGGGIGASLGWVAGFVIDVSVLAYDTQGPSRRARAFTIAPDVQISSERTTIGAVGVF